MQYDFDTVIDRRGKDAMAVDIPASGKGGHYLAHIQVDPGFDCIPMWIADMNFATAPCIPKALAERSLHRRGRAAHLRPLGAGDRRLRPRF